MPSLRDIADEQYRARLAREMSHIGTGYTPSQEEINTAIDVGMGRKPADIAYGEEGLRGGMELGRIGDMPVSLTDLLPVDMGANALATLAKLGTAKMGALPVLAGIFAGKGAKTADLSKLLMAEELKKTGVTSPEIWKKTGWALDTPDKMPRFEIPDNEAGFIPTRWNRPYEMDLSATQAKLSDAMAHDGLYGAYPSTSNIDIVNNKNLGFTRGEYHAPREDIGLGEYMQLGLDRESRLANETRTANDMMSKNQKTPFSMYWRDLIKEGNNDGMERSDSILDTRKFLTDVRKSRDELKSGVLWPSTDSSVKSTVLHELQHAIQQREGFARGGSPDTSAGVGMTKDNTMEYARKAYEQSHQTSGDPLLEELLGGAKKWEELTPREQLGWIDQGRMSAYRNLAGEAEARLTQARMNLTSEQRLAQYPYEPAYFQKATGVPLNDLIVRYGEGKAMSAPAKTEFNLSKYKGLSPDEQGSALEQWGKENGVDIFRSGSSNKSDSLYYTVRKPKDYDPEYGYLDSDTAHIRVGSHFNQTNTNDYLNATKRYNIHPEGDDLQSVGDDILEWLKQK